MQVSENHHGSVNGVAYYSGVSDQVRCGGAVECAHLCLGDVLCAHECVMVSLSSPRAAPTAPFASGTPATTAWCSSRTSKARGDQTASVGDGCDGDGDEIVGGGMLLISS